MIFEAMFKLYIKSIRLCSPKKLLNVMTKFVKLYTVVSPGSAKSKKKLGNRSIQNNARSPSCLGF